MGFKVLWTNEAVENLEDILQYLESIFSHKEVAIFKAKLNSLIQLISKTPTLFPLSEHNNRFRKAVLSKQTTLYYEIKEDQVILALLFQSKQDPKRIT